MFPKFKVLYLLFITLSKKHFKYYNILFSFPSEFATIQGLLNNFDFQCLFSACDVYFSLAYYPVSIFVLIILN